MNDIVANELVETEVNPATKAEDFEINAFASASALEEAEGFIQDEEFSDDPLGN